MADVDHALRASASASRNEPLARYAEYLSAIASGEWTRPIGSSWIAEPASGMHSWNGLLCWKSDASGPSPSSSRYSGSRRSST